MIVALMLAAATPSPEAIALGRQIAEAGTLGAVLPLMQVQEADQLVAAHPDLSVEEQAALRAIAKQVYEVGYARIMDAEGRAWANELGIDELRAVAAFQQSAAGKTYKAALPKVIGVSVKSLGELHYKEDVLAAFCKRTGKLCEGKR